MYLVITDDGKFKRYLHQAEVPDDQSVTLVIPLDDAQMPLIHLLQGQNTPHARAAFVALLMRSYNHGFSRGRAREKSRDASLDTD